MKNFTPLTLIMALLFGGTTLSAQSCELYTDYSEGTTTKMVHYDQKDKVTGVTTTTVKELKSTPVDFHIVMEQHYDNLDEYTFSSEFEVHCKNGDITVSMGNFIDPTTMEAYEDMEFKVQADDLSIPSGAKPGDVLNDGSVSVSVESGTPIPINIVATVSNRRVTAKETITTPAGSFDCLKIEYDMLTEVSFLKIRSQIAEYHNKKHGTIRSETLNKKGKLKSYTQLEEITK